MSSTDHNLSPTVLRQQTFRAGLSALGWIAAILVLCAIFCAIGISRSAKSNVIFKHVTYQQTLAEKLAKELISLEKLEDKSAYLKGLEQLELTVQQAQTVQHNITMPDRWGAMDAYEVDTLRRAFHSQPLMLNQRFGQMIGAYDALLLRANEGQKISASEFEETLEKTEEFSQYQGQAVQIYQDRIAAVRDQSRWRISLTFLFTFLSLGVIAAFVIHPFSKRIESQALAVKQVNDKLKVVALRDPLTGLPNRIAVTQRIDRELERAKANNMRLGVAHIDLDHFKEVNDKYGHAAGDYMLIEIAKRMQAWQGDTNFIARFGGDEFVAVMSCKAIDCTLKNQVERLLNSIALPMNFEGITLQTTASIGVSPYLKPNDNTADLIINADLALYESKQMGRNCYAFFKPAMRDTLERRKALESELKAGIDNDEIRPFFQPQLDIRHNAITGAEALMRWNHPTRGLVSAEEFLPVARSAGLMVRLGRTCMEKAIIEAARWHSQNIPFGRLALNACPSELAEEDFVDWLLATAQKHKLPTNMLSIEILETVVFKDSPFNLKDKITQLRRADIHIELDDFGTGYASLQQVKTDEIDRIKIDRSFIKNIDSNHASAMIVRTILRLAESLNIDVIAEGAETLGELQALLSIGCQTVQGYGIAQPMPCLLYTSDAADE